MIAEDYARKKQVVLTFDLDARSWARGAALPKSPLNDPASTSTSCATTILEQTLIVATSTVSELVLLLGDENGDTFRTRTVPYPADWGGRGSILDVEVSELLHHGNELIIGLCTRRSYYDACAAHIIRVNLLALADAPSPTVTWQDVQGGVVHPSEQYAGFYGDTFSGAAMDTDGIGLTQVGDAPASAANAARDAHTTVSTVAAR